MADSPDESERRRFQRERQDFIVQSVFREGRVEVAELAERFAVTAETVRRDLSELDRQRLVRRVHGGAIPHQSLRHEPLLSVRHQKLINEKRRIGLAAIDELPEGGTALVDSGSSTLMLCEAIPLDYEATIVTNSLLNAQVLADRPSIDVIVLGGALKKSTFAMIDPITTQTISDLRVDVAFIGCDGISADRGLSTPYRAEASIKAAMIDSARRTVALLDHSKFGVDHLVGVALCSAIDVIITDDGTDETTADAFEEYGTQVRRV